MNYYNILKVKEDSTEFEIKQSYKKLAKLYHPDKTNNDPIKTEMFKNIVLAYNTLSDIKKRKNYDDNFLKKNNQEKVILKENIEQDKPINIDLYIDWNDTLNGTKKTINFSIIKFCDYCAGRGLIYSNICNNCNGTGQKAYEKKYHVSIPVNTLPESEIRLKNIGHISKPNLEQGDIILNIHWKKGKWVFIDNNIYTYLHLSRRDILRKKTSFTNYDGKKHIVYIPDNIKNGQLLRLKGKGWYINNTYSDLYLEVIINKNNFWKKLLNMLS